MGRLIAAFLFASCIVTPAVADSFQSPAETPEPLVENQRPADPVLPEEKVGSDAAVGPQVSEESEVMPVETDSQAGVIPSEETIVDGEQPIGTVKDSLDVQGEKPKSVKAWLDSQPRKKKGAIKGALAGALGGALGAIAMGKNPLAGAAIGAGAGALAGYLIGRRKDKVFAARDAAVAEIGYEPSQGYVIQVQEVSFNPVNLAPGSKTEVYVRYLVIGPDPKEKIVLQAYTGIKYDEDYLFGIGPDKVVVARGGGIVETTQEVTIPEDAPPGSYMIEALFEERSGRSSESRESALYVIQEAQDEKKDGVGVADATAVS